MTRTRLPLLIMIVVLMWPTPAHAARGFWGWLEELSGPGPFKGWGYIQPVACVDRETNRLKPTQAQTIVAAAILRQLYAVITTGQAWDPDIAAHGLRQANPVGIVAA